MKKTILLNIILFQMLFYQISAEDTFDCTGYDDDSVHPMSDPTDCQYYWQCIFVDTTYMHAIKRSCPAGTLFDAELKECEISSLVDCTSIRSSDTIELSTSTKLTSIIHDNKGSNQLKVLPRNASQSLVIYTLEQLIKSLNDIALHQKSQSSSYFEQTTSKTKHLQLIQLESTSVIPSLTKKIQRKHIHYHYRHKLKLNILTSNERKIRQYMLNQTHGILINCNEIQHRQLRDLIYRTTKVNPIEIRNSTSHIMGYNILSLTILIFVLFLQK